MSIFPIEPVAGLRPRRRAYSRRPTAIDRCLGRTVRHMRRSKGITQVSLAETIGISFPQIQKYETGANRMSVSTLIRISEALDISPHDLIAAACAEFARTSTNADSPRSQ